jgi:hypothetical protein
MRPEPVKSAVNELRTEAAKPSFTLASIKERRGHGPDGDHADIQVCGDCAEEPGRDELDGYGEEPREPEHQMGSHGNRCGCIVPRSA